MLEAVNREGNPNHFDPDATASRRALEALRAKTTAAAKTCMRGDPTAPADTVVKLFWGARADALEVQTVNGTAVSALRQLVANGDKRPEIRSRNCVAEAIAKQIVLPHPWTAWLHFDTSRDERVKPKAN
ncbi:MAG: hypothetical protein R3A78_15680 [Polyangiales bacterium]|nr:hypothetical protein [Myxococcales bacterium]